jgi:hypothetical protein
MLVATSVRRSLFAVTVIVASVLGTAGATTASVYAASQARPAATVSAHVLADGGPDDTPWG